jgi:hypothetical protein
MFIAGVCFLPALRRSRAKKRFAPTELGLTEHAGAINISPL